MARDALELDTRRDIYQFIVEHPGAYLRQMEGEMGLAVGQLEYHLNYLVKEELLTLEDEGFRKRYFAVSTVSHSDKPLISLLRQKVPRRIVLHVMLDPGVSFQDLTAVLGVSKSTLSFHLSKLLKAGVLEKGKSGRRTVYSVAEPDRVARLVLQYKESFVDRLVDRFADAWLELE